MDKEPSPLPIPGRPGPFGNPRPIPKAPNHGTSALLPFTPEDYAGKWPQEGRNGKQVRVWVGWRLPDPHPFFGRRGKHRSLKIFLFPLCHRFCKPPVTDWKKLGINPAWGQPLGHRTEGKDHHLDTP